MRTILPTILATAAFACTGCGTAANTLWLIPEEGGQRAYGGVRVDLENANPLAHDSGIVTEAGSVPLTPAGRMGRLAFLCVDLPLSAIGDTLTLPLILTRQVIDSRTMIRGFTTPNLKLDDLLSRTRSEPAWESGRGTLPPPTTGLDRFPEMRHWRVRT